MNSERRMSFSRFRSNAIYFQQFYASISYSRIQVLLSVRSYRPILVFEYQRYGLLSQCFSCLYIFHETKIYFSSVFNVLGDFLLFNRPAVVVDLVHSHLFTLQFSQSYFRLSNTSITIIPMPRANDNSMQHRLEPLRLHVSVQIILIQIIASHFTRLGTEEVLQYIY